jgi:hypothetical protein
VWLRRGSHDGLVQGSSSRGPEGSIAQGAKLVSVGAPRRGKRADGQSQGAVQGLIPGIKAQSPFHWIGQRTQKGWVKLCNCGVYR